MAKRFRPKSIFSAAFRNAGNGKESPESQKMMRPEFEGLQPSDFKNTAAMDRAIKGDSFGEANQHFKNTAAMDRGTVVRK